MAPLSLVSHPLVLVVAFSSLLLPTGWAQDRIAELQAQFQRESNPIRKAKVLPKLGDAQLGLARHEADAGNYDRAFAIIGEYRDEIRNVEAALKATGVDAERRPTGFKQLQIHLRKSLRELDGTILTLPVSQRERFETIRGELVSIDKELIDLLFPRQPGKSPREEKPKG